MGRVGEGRGGLGRVGRGSGSTERDDDSRLQVPPGHGSSKPIRRVLPLFPCGTSSNLDETRKSLGFSAQKIHIDVEGGLSRQPRTRIKSALP